MNARVVTMKEFVSRARDLVADHWMQAQMYMHEELDGDESEGAALLPQHRGGITRVCSIGAMRLAFAELVGVRIHREYDYELDGTPYVREWVDEPELARHPFYKDGMRVLGRAFFEVEQLAVPRHTLDNPEWLLNGHEGRPYTIQQVEQSVITVNDWEDYREVQTLHEALVAAFDRAVEMAPEDVTTSTTGDTLDELEPVEN